LTVRLEKSKNDEDKFFLLKTADTYKEFYEETYLSLDEELNNPFDNTTGFY